MNDKKLDHTPKKHRHYMLTWNNPPEDHTIKDVHSKCNSYLPNTNPDYFWGQKEIGKEGTPHF